MITTEELRKKLITRIDALLSQWLLVRGEDRALLAAVRGFAVEMTEADLARLLTFFVVPTGEMTMPTHPTTFHYPTPAEFQEALPILMARLRNEPVATNDLAHAAYVAAGFGLSIVLPHDGGVQADPQLADMRATAAGIDWDGLFSLLIQYGPLLLEIIRKLINPPTPPTP